MIRNASPIDFLNLIAHAQYVISGSFHALCFSLMFHKEFYVTSSPEKDRNVRLTDLLGMIDQMDRWVDDQNYKFDKDKLDYDVIEKKLECEIRSSMETINLICSENIDM